MLHGTVSCAPVSVRNRTHFRGVCRAWGKPRSLCYARHVSTMSHSRHERIFTRRPSKTRHRMALECMQSNIIRPLRHDSFRDIAKALTLAAGGFHRSEQKGRRNIQCGPCNTTESISDRGGGPLAQRIELLPTARDGPRDSLKSQSHQAFTAPNRTDFSEPRRARQIVQI